MSATDGSKAEDEEDHLTTAQGLFNYGDSYLTAAHALWAANINVVFPEAPVRFLLYHAAELHLKAFLRCAGLGVAEIRAKGHLFSKLLPLARKHGFELDRECQALLIFGQRSGDVIESRYIRTGFRRWYPTETVGRCAAEVRRAVRTHPTRPARIILRGSRDGFVDDACERVWLGT